jgi:hypothetical protein
LCPLLLPSCTYIPQKNPHAANVAGGGQFHMSSFERGVWPGLPIGHGGDCGHPWVGAGGQMGHGKWGHGLDGLGSISMYAACPSNSSGNIDVYHNLVGK